MGPEIFPHWVLSGPVFIKHGSVFTKKTYCTIIRYSITYKKRDSIKKIYNYSLIDKKTNGHYSLNHKGPTAPSNHQQSNNNHDEYLSFSSSCRKNNAVIVLWLQTLVSLYEVNISGEVLSNYSMEDQMQSVRRCTFLFRWIFEMNTNKCLLKFVLSVTNGSVWMTLDESTCTPMYLTHQLPRMNNICIDWKHLCWWCILYNLH